MYQVAVFFWASWSQPCKQLDLVFEQLAIDNSSVRFLRVGALNKLLCFFSYLRCRVTDLTKATVCTG